MDYSTMLSVVQMTEWSVNRELGVIWKKPWYNLRHYARIYMEGWEPSRGDCQNNRFSFFCRLFNDTYNIGRKRPWPNRGTILAFSWRDKVKVRETCSQENQYPCRESNRAPPGYKSRGLSVDQPCRDINPVVREYWAGMLPTYAVSSMKRETSGRLYLHPTDWTVHSFRGTDQIRLFLSKIWDSM
jgi:hypothetical protein